MFSSDTPIITNKGSHPLSYFQEGENVQIVDKNGVWRMATIHHPGRRKVNKISIFRKQAKTTLLATPNHLWIAPDGKVTEELEKDSKIMKAANISHFDFYVAPRMERQHWCYGFVYRNGIKLKDGTCVTVKDDGYDHYKKFKAAGFMSKPSPLFEKEYNCYVEGYFRERFITEQVPVSLIRAFVNGYLDAFSHEKYAVFRDKEGNMTHRYFYTFPHDLLYLREILPMAGFYIVTEFPQGKRTKMNLFNQDIKNTVFVSKIQEFGMVKVSQVKVKGDDPSFTLPWGIVSRDL